MMINAILFTVSYLCLMLIPGWLLLNALRVGHNRLLLSIALSVAVTTLNLVLARLLGVHYAWSVVLTAVESVIFLLVALRAGAPSPLVGGTQDHRYALGGLVMVALAVGAWSGVSGPYLEVPADGWWHLAKIKEVMAALGQDPRAAPWDRLWYAPNLYGYFLPAVAAWLCGLSVVDVIRPLNAINSVLFCAALYTFALFVFERSGLGGRQRVWCAAATVAFFVLQFGVNVFSYLRYYVYAPAFVNYLLYLSAAALLTAYHRTGQGRAELPLFGLLCAAAYLVHKQEFMFIVLMTSMLVAVQFFRSRRDAALPNRGTAVALFSVVVMVWAALWILSYTELPRSNPLAYDTVIPLEQVLPFFRHLFVADPTFQFYEVLAVWGVIVYALFFTALFRGERMPAFVIAGMLVPFVTIFNPLFVDLFLRHNYADVLWRSCYMIPLPFAGAWYFTRAVRGLTEWRGRPIRNSVLDAAVAAALVILLFPISTTFFESRYSRLYTVLPVKPSVEHEQWQDMFAFLSGIDREAVITDQVTGYMVNALTPHRYDGHKFYGFGAPKIRRSRYGKRTFSEHRGALVIVNRRDGGLSLTGRLSGHWPENILKVSRFYPRGFLSHIENSPEKYRKLWEQNGIQVYEIQS